ncbi:MAG: hypothetical protein ACI9Q9_000799 [Flavobacterium sp.]|jgi:hypothetical protein
MLISSIKNRLKELVDLLEQLSNAEYAKPYLSLSSATIGEHTRHIVEMFQCLINNYESGIINYDKRARNIVLQTDTNFAITQILNIQYLLEKENKKMELQQIINDKEIGIDSNYFRELLYNLDHCIHHQALIKVAVLQNSTLFVNDNFGVAISTIEYRNRCAQ